MLWPTELPSQSRKYFSWKRTTLFQRPWLPYTHCITQHRGRSSAFGNCLYSECRAERFKERRPSQGQYAHWRDKSKIVLLTTSPKKNNCCEQGSILERSHSPTLCLSTMAGLLGETSSLISPWSRRQVTHRERELRWKKGAERASGAKSWSLAGSAGGEVGLSLKTGYSGGTCLVE